MTSEQLDTIEAELGVKLPAEYRATSEAMPFRPSGNDSVYWFFDDPRRVIDETRFPLEDGDDDGAVWRPGYVVIGHGACGDLYLIDTESEGTPVHYLDHETHAIVPEYPTFAAFVEEWLRHPEAMARAAKAEAAKRKAAAREFNRRAMLIFGVLLALMGLTLAVMVLAWSMGGR